MKNVFNRLISRWNIYEERIFGLETSKLKSKKNGDYNQNRTSKDCGTILKDTI